MINATTCAATGFVRAMPTTCPAAISRALPTLAATAKNVAPNVPYGEIATFFFKGLNQVFKLRNPAALLLVGRGLLREYWNRRR
jgi:hypothetical protein